METPTGAMNLGSFVHRVLEEAVKLKVESGGNWMIRSSAGIAGTGCVVGVCCSGHRSATSGTNIRKNWSCGITPCQVDSQIKRNHSSSFNVTLKIIFR